MRRNVYRDGHVFVAAEMCPTCVFRPGNPMHLEKGRVRGMVEGSLGDSSAIVCHDTLDSDNAVCRGFYDRYETEPLALAKALDRISLQ